ncbi:hypothetical protein BJ165DRAFT_631689 [Panaeolus papilionaceus]|nr:hypothetical protein BJ165DRAFT_631689 [Panaeolus papilionaceus]
MVNVYLKGLCSSKVETLSCRQGGEFTRIEWEPEQNLISLYRMYKSWLLLHHPHHQTLEPSTVSFFLDFRRTDKSLQLSLILEIQPRLKTVLFDIVMPKDASGERSKTRPLGSLNERRTPKGIRASLLNAPSLQQAQEAMPRHSLRFDPIRGERRK